MLLREAAETLIEEAMGDAHERQLARRIESEREARRGSPSPAKRAVCDRRGALYLRRARGCSSSPTCIWKRARPSPGAAC